MNLAPKLILLSLLLVTGVSSLVVRLCGAESTRELRAQVLAADGRQARQIVDVLGPTLLQDRAGSAAQEALGRILTRDPECNAIYSTILQGDGAVVVQEVRRGEGRSAGTRLTLPPAGRRASRTGRVQSMFIERGEGEIIQAFAPIFDHSGKVAGLLVVESDTDPVVRHASDHWFGYAISILAGLVAVAWLLSWIACPLVRLQEQLATTENLPRERVRSPADILREVAKILQKVQADRSYYEDRLRQQDQAQEDSNRVKDEMIANTVHELRTPLTSIIASLEIVLRHNDMMNVEEQNAFLEQASIAGNHMMYIVNDLLDAAALEAGKLTMEIETCNLRKVLTEAKKSMDLIAAGKGMTLETPHISPDINILADNARVMQVICNLVSNAVKYSPDDTTITMRAWASRKSVLIEVQDQGQGVPSELRAQLFNRFSQLSREGDGTRVHSSGIGLYLSKELVELMQGTIGFRAVDSGPGSVFWFTLPLAVVESPAELLNV